MIVALFRLMRPYYTIPIVGGFITIVTYLVGGKILTIYKEVAFSSISLFCIISAGYVLNDVCDVAIDKINCPNRMLPSGRLKRKTAAAWSITFFIIGLTAAIFCSWPFFAVMALITIALIFYDIFSKRIGIFKDILVACLMTSLYPLAFTLTSPIDTPRLKVLLIHPIWLFLSSLSYEMLKDIRDVKGDSEISNKAKTYYGGNKWFLYISRTIMIAASFITLLPFVLGYCKWIYLIASISGIIFVILAAFKNPRTAIRCLYAEIFLVTLGSLIDLLVFGT